MSRRVRKSKKKPAKARATVNCVWCDRSGAATPTDLTPMHFECSLQYLDWRSFTANPTEPLVV